MKKSVKIVIIIVVVGIICILAGLAGGFFISRMGQNSNNTTAPVITQVPAQTQATAGTDISGGAGNGQAGANRQQGGYGTNQGNSAIYGLDMEFEGTPTVNVSAGDKFSVAVDGYEEFVQYGGERGSTNGYRTYMEGRTWIIETLPSAASVSVTIPANCELGNVDISAEGANVNWNVPFTANRFELDLERGSFYMTSATTAQHMDLSAEGADVVFEGTMALSGAEVEVDGGRTLISDVSGGCSWNVSGDRGEVEIHSGDRADNYNYVIGARSSLSVNGENITEQRRINAPYTIYVEDTGAVRFYFEG